MKIKANQLKIGDKFKKAENYIGTYTYIVKSLPYTNIYGLLTYKCLIIDCTNKDDKTIGTIYPVSFRRYQGTYKIINTLNN